ncbi:hypothetical protein BJY00DRAFT_293720 [Aspergillus carlsbadensis]|nr:hypothetical protein BJY00DRAFT_293720 [Aspergillus carlsbadensis]
MNIPNRTNTFPKPNPQQPERTRYQTGFPNTMWGERNDFPGTAPPRDRDGFDKYRQALANGAQPPAESPFNQQYQAYKQQDAAAHGLRDEYSNFVRSYQQTQQPSRAQIAQSPQTYAGQPKATRDWHDSAGAKAGEARDAFQRAADGRRDMAQAYIGYDTQSSAAGHKTRERRRISVPSGNDRRSCRVWLWMIDNVLEQALAIKLVTLDL